MAGSTMPSTGPSSSGLNSASITVLRQSVCASERPWARKSNSHASIGYSASISDQPRSARGGPTAVCSSAPLPAIWSNNLKTASSTIGHDSSVTAALILALCSSRKRSSLFLGQPQQMVGDDAALDLGTAAHDRRGAGVPPLRPDGIEFLAAAAAHPTAAAPHP